MMDLTARAVAANCRSRDRYCRLESHHIPALQAGNPMFKPIATDIADLTARAAAPIARAVVVKSKHRLTPTYDLPLTTYDLRLTTYDLQLTTYNLRLKSSQTAAS